MCAALPKSSPSAGSDEEALLRSCLSRLLVVHCSSSAQLLLTLHFLENSFSSRPSLELLLIDSISAFYWLDRCEGGPSFSKQEEKLSKCSDLLSRLLRYSSKKSNSLIFIISDVSVKFGRFFLWFL